jgi:ceroid-lipofuscinosis MFS transporter 7
MPIIASLVIFIVSNAMYSSLDLIENGVKYWMLIIRFLTGVASANIAVSRSYIAAATKVDERTHALSMASLSQVGGFIVGPLLQAGFSQIGDGFTMFGGLHMNMYTAPGKKIKK